MKFSDWAKYVAMTAVYRSAYGATYLLSELAHITSVARDRLSRRLDHEWAKETEQEDAEIYQIYPKPDGGAN